MKKPLPATKRSAKPAKPASKPAKPAAKPAKPAAKPATTAQPVDEFAIVGIGASAGGLEALEQFLLNTPPACGMAFVIVQHLDPNYKGMLAELLQRATAMPVVQIKDRTRVRPDHVYVIPPDRDLSILNGVLHLLAPAAPRGLRLPIDYFLRSLADDRREHGIGVILSGMGSDGTLGLRAIKEKAGAVFVQSPASAKFDAMPRSAINAGLADVVAPAEELAGKIVAYRSHAPLLVPHSDEHLAHNNQSALEKVVLLLRTQTGHDFSLYKKSTIYRRIERRMGLHQLAGIVNYVRYLRDNPAEGGLLFKELLIGVTSFFRDPEAWVQLKTEVIPALLAARPDGTSLRAWVPACSTGEEAYSLAMVFREALTELKTVARYSLQIFATDLDKDAIDKARTGVYPSNIAADVSEARLRRFFVEEEAGYRVGKEIREMVIFAPQNLVMDPPFTKLDLLTCRNLLIYLEPELQKKLLPLFHYSLNPGGVLMLGSSETVGHATHLFAALEGKTRLYRRRENRMRAEAVDFPVAFAQPHRPAAPDTLPAPAALPAPNLQTLTDHLLLQNHAPSAVLTTDKGDIVYFSGKTGRYLEPAAGKANLNVFAMARNGLRSPLYDGFARAVQQKSTLTLKALPLAGDNAGRIVDIAIEPLDAPEMLRGMVLIVFKEASGPAPGKAARKSRQLPVPDPQLAALTAELEQAHSELRTTRDEMQTSQEELKSANEEMQSSNEELQSTNEELTTSKEEMQSMNEEMQTVNQELQSKVDELSRTSDDMANLLNSTDIATLFLDNDLKVRRFTDRTAGIIKLIPGDAGRPITDIATELDYPGMEEDAHTVLRSLTSHERKVAGRAGRWFSVRIMPYRTQDNRIDGLVLTFSDCSAAVALEATLDEAETILQSHAQDRPGAPDAVARLASLRLRLKTVLGQRPDDADVNVYVDVDAKAKAKAGIVDAATRRRAKGRT